MTNIAVLFDCDGVLVNTEEIGYRIMSEMLAEHDFTYTREEFTELVSGVEQKFMIKKVTEDFLEKKGYPLPDDFEKTLWRRMLHAWENEAKVIDGVRELLQNLKASNIPYAVCSNSYAGHLVHKLRNVGLYEDFAPYIYSKDHVERPKPFGDMYLEAARVFNNAAQNKTPYKLFVVEDSQTGTKAGVAAGATVIGFVGEQHRGDHEADYLEEAGASFIAFSPEAVWDIIAEQAGLKLKFPYLGTGIQP